MRRSEFVTFVKGRQEELIQLLEAKGDEYAQESSAFYNFEEGYSISTSFSRESYAWNLMTKHLQSLKDIINGDIEGVDLINEKCSDISAYVYLIWAMLLENQEAKNTAEHGIIS